MVRMLVIKEQSYAPDLKQARHAHANTTVTMVLGGSLWERVGGVEEIARPLSIVIKPRDTEHANHFGARGARTLQILIPNDAISALAAWHEPLEQWGWQHAGFAVASFAKLLWAVRTLPAEHPELQSCAHEALAALSCNAERSHGIPVWLKTVRDMIDDAVQPPRLSHLARHADVHPVYLARQFRRTFGCSVSEYIQRRRIQRVAELISADEKTLSAAAHTVGFADHAHMCRVFRQQIRMAPGDLRAALTS